VLVRIDRFRAEPLDSSDVVAEDGQLALFAEPEDVPAPRATPVLPPLAPLPDPSWPRRIGGTLGMVGRGLPHVLPRRRPRSLTSAG